MDFIKLSRMLDDGDIDGLYNAAEEYRVQLAERDERVKALENALDLAMRQPTAKMIDAGNAAVPGTVNADNIYMAMVRETLK